MDRHRTVAFCFDRIGFAGIGFVIGGYQLFSELFCRYLVISKLGIDKLGLYSPILAWGGLYTTLILPAIYTYLYPRFSESKNNDEISGITNDIFRMLSFYMIPFLFIGIAFRYIIIPIFYSNEFILAANYLPLHFIGIYFFMLTEALSQVFTPKGKIKALGFFRIIMFSLNIFLVTYFINDYGLGAWMLKFLATPLIFFFIFLIYLNITFELKIEIKNIQIISFVLLSSLALLFISEYNQYYAMMVSILLLLLSLKFLTTHEKEILKDKINTMIKG